MTSTGNAPQLRPSREDNRRELARQLDLEPDRLADGVRLVGDLALDSLGMMTVVAWLESRGVQVAGDQLTPARVGDVLTLLDQVPSPRVSVLITGNGTAAGAAAVPALAGPARTAPPPLAPVLANTVFRLTPVQPGDVPFLFALSVEPETGFRWRYRGAPPSVERFAAELWAQVLVHYVVRGTATNEPVGYVVAYQADLSRGHAYLGAVFAAAHAGTGLTARATALFVRYLFHTFPLRKVYLEVPGWNWPQIASAAGTRFHVEGVLREHDYYAGRLWDKYVCAIYRDGRRPDTSACH
jgi:RimJ/RimL family protein N-acetyltransferase/aryl carrier-like protein